MHQESLALVSSLVTPILVAVVAYFLRSLMDRFKELEADLKHFLISNAHFEQRLITLENRMKLLDELVLDSIKVKHR